MDDRVHVLIAEDETVIRLDLRQLLEGEGLGDDRRDEIRDRAVEGRELAHAARREEAVLRRRHQVHGLDVGCEPLVQVAHLELPLVVRDGPQALHDRRDLGCRRAAE